MGKRIAIAMVAVFAVWSVTDFLIHGLLLKSAYLETATLWRPEAEMKMGLMSVVTLLFSICFVALYAFWIERKSIASGVGYGLLLGLIIGIPMGFGSYRRQWPGCVSDSS